MNQQHIEFSKKIYFGYTGKGHILTGLFFDADGFNMLQLSAVNTRQISDTYIMIPREAIPSLINTLASYMLHEPLPPSIKLEPKI